MTAEEHGILAPCSAPPYNRRGPRSRKERAMPQDQQQEQAKQGGQVVARAWSDEAYKQRLLSDPQAVLAEAGLSVPANVQVQVHEATPTLLHLVLPPAPTGLSEEQLDALAGGLVHGDSGPCGV